MKTILSIVIMMLCLFNISQCITNEAAIAMLDNCNKEIDGYADGWENEMQKKAPKKEVNKICRNWGCVEEGDQLFKCMDKEFYEAEYQKMLDDPKGEFPLLIFQNAVNSCNVPQSIKNKPGERAVYKTQLEYGAFIDYQKCTCQSLNANCSSSNLSVFIGVIVAILSLVLL